MKVKDLKETIKDLDDDVELYYPHYYKGHGLIPVSELKIGEVEGQTVGVFDWETLLVTDENFISKLQEDIKQFANKVIDKAAK